jgi:hypothetical protein
MNHHHLVAISQRDDVDPVGGIEDEEVVLAAAGVARAALVEIEDGGAEGDIGGEGFPFAGFHVEVGGSLSSLSLSQDV